MNRIVRMLLGAACLVSLVSFVPVAARADALPTLPAPAASFDVGTLHVDRYGSGPHAIVFIPGLTCGPWAWADAIAHFSPSYTVYALTLDGFDGRPYVPHRDLIASFTSDFYRFLAREHVTKPVVVGHSLGGTLVFALAQAHPDRLAGIVALDGLPVFPAMAAMTPEQRATNAAAMSAQIAAATHAQFLAYEETMMKRMTLRANLVDAAAQREAASDPKAAAAWLRVDLDDDLRPQLSRITIPVLELMPYAPGGPYTQAQTLAFYRMLLGGAPRVSVEPIVPARHFAMLDQPKAVDAAITRFLATAAW